MHIGNNWYIYFVELHVRMNRDEMYSATKHIYSYMEEDCCSMCIDCTKGVIEDIRISITIDCSCELNPLLLPAAHVQTSLTYLRKVTMIEALDIFVQSTTSDSLLIRCLVHWLPIENIVTYRPALNPRCLGYIRY